MPKKLKPIPRFRSEAEERRFWETHDTEHDRNIAAPAIVVARADQDRSEQARCAVPIVDQDLAC